MSNAFDRSRYKTYDTSKGFGNAKKWRAAFNERISPEEARERIRAQAMTPYELLGVSPDATEAEIKRAFRKLMMEWHPDRNPHRLKEAEEMSKLIISAYTILTT